VAVEVDHDDVLVGYQGRTYWYEIKNPERAVGSNGEVRETRKQDTQKVLDREWSGHRETVWNVDQILYDIGVLK